MNSTDVLLDWSEYPSNSSQFFQFQNATSSGGASEVTATASGDQSPASHFVLHPAAMIGGLSVQTVSFILLGVGAAAPILLVTSVAVVLRLRRMRRRSHYSKYVFSNDDDYCTDVWHEHGDGAAGEPVQHQRKAVNGNRAMAVASFSEGKQSSFDVDGVLCGERSSDGRYPLSSHDLDAVIKTFFGLTRDETKTSPSSTTFKDTTEVPRSTPMNLDQRRSNEPNDATNGETKSPTTLLNVRALVEVSERNENGCDTGDFSYRIPGSGSIRKGALTSGRLGIPPNGGRASGESSRLNSSDSIRRSVDSSLSYRSETYQMFFQAEELDSKPVDDGEEEEHGRGENGNATGSQDTSVYFDAESSPSVFRNSATPNLNHDAILRHTLSPSNVYSSFRRQEAAALPVFGVEEERVLRCLDEVLLEYMDNVDDSDARTNSDETSTTAHL